MSHIGILQNSDINIYLRMQNFKTGYDTIANLDGPYMIVLKSLSHLKLNPAEMWSLPHS